MQEETNLSVRQHFADHTRHKKQMVIVYPDCVTALETGDDLVCKGLIEASVELPRVVFVGFALRVVRDLIMENRPKDRLAVVALVTIQVTIRGVDSQRFVLVFELLVNLVFSGFTKSIRGKSQSAYPDLLRYVSFLSNVMTEDGIDETTIALETRFY